MDDDLDASIAWFRDTVGGRDKLVSLAVGRNGQKFWINTLLNEQLADDLGPAAGKFLIQLNGSG